MNDFNKITSPKELNLLISFVDLTNFNRVCSKKSDLDVYNMLSDFYLLSGDIIENGGGKIVKFIGDSALLVFSENKVDQGVKALIELKKKVDVKFQKEESPCRLIVKAHFGSAVCGKLGTKNNMSFDIIGSNVNTAALMKSYGLAITPQVFRKLTEETRKIFKKHTPAIRYIPVEESHKD